MNKRMMLFLCVLAMSGQMALAADAGNKASPMKMPNLTSDQRQKMAGAHEKMATCLRTEKPLNECHEEMMKACQEGMGKDGCPMMGGKMGHRGRHHAMDSQTGSKE